MSAIGIQTEGGDLGKVEFLLDENELFGSEMCWCDRLNDGRYRVADIPLYVVGVSNGDVIETHPGESGWPEFVRVVQSGGHTTVRIIPQRSRQLASIKRRFAAIGCRSARGWGRWVAVDIPASVDPAVFLSVLDRGAATGHWVYEPEPVARLRRRVARRRR